MSMTKPAPLVQSLLSGQEGQAWGCWGGSGHPSTARITSGPIVTAQQDSSIQLSGQLNRNSSPFFSLPLQSGRQEQFRSCAGGGKLFVSNEQCVMSLFQTFCFLVILGDKNPLRNNPF